MKQIKGTGARRGGRAILYSRRMLLMLPNQQCHSADNNSYLNCITYYCRCPTKNYIILADGQWYDCIQQCRYYAMNGCTMHCGINS